MVAGGIILSSQNTMRSLNDANYSSRLTAHTFLNRAFHSQSVAYLSTSSSPPRLPWIYFDIFLCAEV